jgi:hypothetical protein
MNPSQFVKDECCNLNDGVCLTNEKPCLVLVGKRCDYFETAVLPIAQQPSPKSDPDLQSRRAEAVAEYAWKHKAGNGSSSPCPDCGGAKPKGHRYCESCARKRRKSSFRRTRETKAVRRATVEA